MIREALFAIAFFQIILTPVALLWWQLDISQYLAWSASNAVLSPILGIAYTRARALFIR